MDTNARTPQQASPFEGMVPAPDEGLGPDLWPEEGPTWDLGAAENTPFLDAAKASLAKGNPEGADLAATVSKQLLDLADDLTDDPARAKALMLSDEDVERMRKLGELAEQFSADNRVALLDQPKEGTALGDFTHETGLIRVYRVGDLRNTLVHELSHASRDGSEDSDLGEALDSVVRMADSKNPTRDEAIATADYYLLKWRDEVEATIDGNMAGEALRRPPEGGSEGSAAQFQSSRIQGYRTQSATASRQPFSEARKNWMKAVQLWEDEGWDKEDPSIYHNRAEIYAQYGGPFPTIREFLYETAMPKKRP